MKKLLALIPLLCFALGASASFTVTPHEGSAADLTVVYFDLWVNGAKVDPGSFSGNYEVAAFIGKECRAVAVVNYADPTTASNSYLAINVPGNYGTGSEDNGEPITFQVFINQQGATYQLTSDQYVTFDSQVTYGEPSGTNKQHVQLSVTTPPVNPETGQLNITLNDITMNVGETVILNRFVNMDINAVLPEGITWSATNADVKISDSLLTAKKPTIDGQASYTLTLPAVQDATGAPVTPASFTGKLYIYAPATAINVSQTAYTVAVGEADKLNAFLATAYTVTPTNTTDIVTWLIGDPTIIAPSATAANKFEPLKAGETTMTPVVKNADGSTRLSGAAITITVTQPVTRLDISNEGITSNLGDTDIKTRLEQLITVVPDDATNKKLSWAINQDDGVLTMTESGDITAAKAGSTSVVATTTDGSNLSVTLKVNVMDPATQATFTQNPLTLAITNNNGTNITNDVLANIKLNGTTSKDATIAVASTTDGVITGSAAITDNGNTGTITAYKAGNATVTVTVTWLDYSTNTNKSSQASFQLQITENIAVQSFDIAVTPDKVDPTKGTVTLTPVPANATITASDYTVVPAASAYGSWETAVVTRDASNALSFQYSAVLPGSYSFQVMKGQTAITTTGSNNSVEIPYMVSLDQGWQWKSNTYGAATDASTLATLFGGTNLAEARTQDALLYDDSKWGYVGSLLQSGIAERQMYKVKMESATTSYLTGGTIPSGALTVDLKRGWNWVGSQYFYNRQLGNALNPANLPAGMVIQGKSGSAEVANGQWNGDLKSINSGEGYLIYNPGAATTLTFATEVGVMSQGDEAGGPTAGARGMQQSVWSYDASRFANNMTIVAKFNGIDNLEDYTLGAFVDDECRGEGVAIDGRMYVTVHADNGELVSFRLHNELTDEYFDVDQTVQSQTRIGSVAAPLAMTAETVTVGINNVKGSQDGASVKTYDLQGREVNRMTNGSHQSRINIVRMSDGSFRKVVK